MDEQRFVTLWARAGSSKGVERGRQVFGEIVQRYSEPQRVYHTGDHIRHCLNQVDRISDDYPDKDAVELAIWFHDVVYEIGDPWNERNSAKWFRRRAEGDLPDALIEQVERMIVATEHREPPAEDDSAYVVDIDLTSFGLPFDEFIADSRRVRAESTHLDDEEFNAGQNEFLEKLLSRERIYQTDLFHDAFEARARRNIRHILESNGRAARG